MYFEEKAYYNINQGEIKKSISIYMEGNLGAFLKPYSESKPHEQYSLHLPFLSFCKQAQP